MNLLKTRKKVNKLLGEFASAKRQCREEKRNLKRAKQELEHIKEAQCILQQVSQMVQQQAHKKIEGVVNKCLEAVFGSEYGFKIRFERKRGRTEAVLLLLKHGHEIEDPMNADSGGVIDVAALALRLSSIVLTKPQLRKVLFMDEPFRNLDLQNRENIRILLETLSKEFKIQFIIVTHEIAFQIGKVIEL